MPIYEFYCAHCHRVFSFLSRVVNTDKTPACPRCRRTELTRRVSAFAISKGRREEPKPEPGPDLDEGRLEQRDGGARRGRWTRSTRTIRARAPS